MEVTIEKFCGAEITEDMVIAAAKLFSEHYGLWAPEAGKKLGSRVTMSPKKLREAILPSSEENIYIRMVGPKDMIVGNVFALRYMSDDGTKVLWITQLCVHSEYRWKGIAYWLLEELRGGGEDLFGILSSHPYAIRAFARAFGDDGLSTTQYDMMEVVGRVRGVMESCPIGYVKNAKLCGQLFEGIKGDINDNDPFSCADTGFGVDHREPDAALKKILLCDGNIYWPPFGSLPDGHEYLVVMKDHPVPTYPPLRGSSYVSLDYPLNW